ncbi:DUF1127 domain-containing protein [Rhizobium sp. 9T]|uniref:DUF1127 domain-containing protein n=1 Tax=Rhizobium croatiense TaxID=2867516 RepID=A0ABS7M0I1_9HYPH|nr:MULTISPECIES: DUF1127 domain-containing protein [Rhizobium]MBY4607157.1 DUF1127 domain-containing protein [Rhizobium croatiense]MBY4630314.1 DUF1127 domain-containing protein [Rhizobium croatiense]PDV89558.1 hypothetical protein CO652_04110 [Rhizobium sp. H4]
MAATKHSEQVELQLLHLSVVGTLQAVWMLLKHQRKYRRSLSEFSRFDSRLLRDIGLGASQRSFPLERSESSKQLSPDKLNWQHSFALCRAAVFNCD